MAISEYLKEFAGLVRNFCNFCEQAPAKNGDERQAIQFVAALYASAFLLQKRVGVNYAGPTVSCRCSMRGAKLKRKMNGVLPSTFTGGNTPPM